MSILEESSSDGSQSTSWDFERNISLGCHSVLIFNSPRGRLEIESEDVGFYACLVKP